MFSLHFELISFLGRVPAPFSLYYRNHRRLSKLVVRPNTEIVIEGFPRCANSFAVLAFEQAQHKEVRIAHHLHAQSQFILGARFQIPILILIREPVSAVASLVARHPEIKIKAALKQYIRFYEAVDDFRSALVVADFKSITSNYASVIASVNARFGTSFEVYNNCPEEDARVFAIIDQLNEDNENGKINQLARPSDAKSSVISEGRKCIETHALTERAYSAYIKCTVRK